MPRPLPDPTPPSRATIRTIHQLGDRIRATRAGDGVPIDQAARHCGVSIGMLSKLENGKGVNLEHALRVMDGLGLTMLVVPKAHAPWERPGSGPCGQDRRGCGQGTACLAGRVETPVRTGVILGCGPRSVRKCHLLGVRTRLPPC